MRGAVSIGYGEPKRARCRKRRIQPRGYLRTNSSLPYSEAGCAIYDAVGSGDRTVTARALALLSTLHSADIILPTTDGREIRLRRITTPNPEQQLLLDQLGIILPERLSFDSECSVDSATA